MAKGNKAVPKTNPRRIGGMVGSFKKDIEDLQKKRDALYAALDAGTDMLPAARSGKAEHEPTMTREEVLALHEQINIINMEIEGLKNLRERVGENYYYGGKN